MARDTVSRSMHDVGLAAWFGGTLANAVALNSAAAQGGSSTDRGAVTMAGWNRWTPVNGLAIGAHVIGALGQLRGNRGRLAGQEGVATMAATKTALTATALGITAYSRVLGRKVTGEAEMPVESGTQPEASTPASAAAAQRQLRVLQWAVPAITGALVVISSFAGEQQRPNEVKAGVLKRALP